jgi:anti-sigma B factor antagonist
VTLEFDMNLRDGHAAVALRGEADVTNAAALVSAIAAVTALHQVVIVELSALEFIDCSALRALLRLQRCAGRSGGIVLIAAPSRNVLRLLSLTGMDGAFRVHPSADAALASIGTSLQAAASQRAEQAGCPVTGPPVMSGSPE